MGVPKLIYFNEKIASLVEHCADLGVKCRTVRERHYKTGEPYEKCLEYYQKYGLRYKEQKVKDMRLYHIWYGMIDRCYNPNNPAYKNYGGKGIVVQESWHDYFNFEVDMYNEYIKHVEEFGEKDTTIDRFPNKQGNYEISNVRWATREEQNNNTDRNIVIDDTTFAQICKDNDLDYKMAWKRFKRGWSIEDIINTPNKKKIIETPTGETVPQLAKRLGVSKHVIYDRLKAGWSWSQILNTPLQEKFSHKKVLDT